MKKIALFSLLFFGMVSISVAQKNDNPKKGKTEKAVKNTSGLTKDGTPDMRLKANKVKTPKPTNLTDGSMDAKVKPTKVKTPKNVTPVNNTNPPVVNTDDGNKPKAKSKAKSNSGPRLIDSANTRKIQKTNASKTNEKVADKVIGTDPKGRSIYQGARGGKYYINKNGNKEYIKD